MEVCTDCKRHLLPGGTECPFCKRSRLPATAIGAVVLSAGLMLTQGCYGAPPVRQGDTRQPPPVKSQDQAPTTSESETNKPR